jgi:hypothetical protein
MIYTFLQILIVFSVWRNYVIICSLQNGIMLVNTNTIKRKLLTSSWYTNNNIHFKKYIETSNAHLCQKEIYTLIRREFKKIWYCSEHTIDWWFKKINTFFKGKIQYNVEITISIDLINVIHRRIPQRVIYL